MSDALTVSPAGFFWQSAKRPLDVRVYGEFSLPARWDPATQNTVDMNERDELSWGDYWKHYKDGTWRGVVGERSGVPALAKILSPSYPHNSTSIPDQIRAEEFLRELAGREKSGKMPNLSVITLDEDHTNGTSPGSPTPRAMVADNDLALGQIVERLSQSPAWPSLGVFVLEDDAQNGPDHVDAHRSVLLVASPYARAHAVDSTFYTTASVLHSIEQILGLAPLSQYDSGAAPLWNAFSRRPDVTQFVHLPNTWPLGEMNPQAFRSNIPARDLGEADEADEVELNREIWESVRPGSAPPPPRRSWVLRDLPAAR
jgi:hypothetical protein